MGQVESGVTVDTLSLSSFSTLGWRRRRRRCRGRFMPFRSIEFARRWIPYYRVEPIDDVQSSAGMLASGHGSERWSNSYKSADDCKHRQHCEWNPHRRRRLVWHVRAVFVTAMSVTSHVSRNVFVNWSNMLARFVTQTISRGRAHRVVLRQPFVKSRRVCFV